MTARGDEGGDNNLNALQKENILTGHLMVTETSCSVIEFSVILTNK